MKIKLNEESLEKLIIDMREESKKLNQTIRDLDLLEERKNLLLKRSLKQDNRVN